MGPTGRCLQARAATQGHHLNATINDDDGRARPTTTTQPSSSFNRNLHAVRSHYYNHGQQFTFRTVENAIKNRNKRATDRAQAHCTQISSDLTKPSTTV